MLPEQSRFSNWGACDEIASTKTRLGVSLSAQGGGDADDSVKGRDRGDREFSSPYPPLPPWLLFAEGLCGSYRTPYRSLSREGVKYFLRSNSGPAL